MLRAFTTKTTLICCLYNVDYFLRTHIVSLVYILHGFPRNVSNLNNPWNLAHWLLFVSLNKKYEVPTSCWPNNLETLGTNGTLELFNQWFKENIPWVLRFIQWSSGIVWAQKIRYSSRIPGCTKTTTMENLYPPSRTHALPIWMTHEKILSGWDPYISENVD